MSALVQATEVVKRLPFEAVVDIVADNVVVVIIACHQGGDDLPEAIIKTRCLAAADALTAAGLVARRQGTASLIVRVA